MSKWRKRPVVVEAEQLTEAHTPSRVKHDGHGGFYVTTAQGEDVRVRYGEWIIPDGEPGLAYPCKPDIFAATYEPVDEALRGVPSPGAAVGAARKALWLIVAKCQEYADTPPPWPGVNEWIEGQARAALSLLRPGEDGDAT